MVKSGLMGDQHSFYILQAFVRALSHRIRTPLSVVSNDLHYLKTFAPPGECDSSADRCREIAKILSETTILGSAPLTIESLRLGDFFQLPEVSVNYHLTPDAFQLMVLADTERWGVLFRELLVLLRSLSNEPGKVHVAATASAGRIELDLELSAVLAPRQVHTSLSSFFCGELGRDSFVAPLLDALIWSHGASCFIGNSQKKYWNLHLDWARGK